jgi:tetratricopeptide (TPR) repeat protein
MKSNDEAKAKEAYDKLNKIAKGELKAEALYYEAYFKNKEGKFDASNKVVEQIAVDYSGYKYFGSKALIIMAKNYFMLGDSFQATEILQSVIDNFAAFEDVLTEAQSELERIKSEEAKRNESITN